MQKLICLLFVRLLLCIKLFVILDKHCVCFFTGIDGISQSSPNDYTYPSVLLNMFTQRWKLKTQSSTCVTSVRKTLAIPSTLK